jgi:hypothetical protein
MMYRSGQGKYILNMIHNTVYGTESKSFMVLYMVWYGMVCPGTYWKYQVP